ncbi:hypothetical protein D3C87_1496610 [compost metagenome]
MVRQAGPFVADAVGQFGHDLFNHGHGLARAVPRHRVARDLEGGVAVVARDLHGAVFPIGLDEGRQRHHASRLVRHVQHQDAFGRHPVTHVGLHHHALQAPGVGKVVDGGRAIGRRDRRADRVKAHAQRFGLLAVNVQAQLRRVGQAFHHGVGDDGRAIGLGQQLVARVGQRLAAQAAPVLQAQRKAA